jgi:hypothetical protein
VRRVEAKCRGHLLEISDYVVSLFLRGAVIFLRGAFDIDAMLIGSGQEKSFDSLLSFLTGNRVRHDHRVEMPEVRQAVGVINRCGDVEGHA